MSFGGRRVYFVDYSWPLTSFFSSSSPSLSSLTIFFVSFSHCKSACRCESAHTRNVETNSWGRISRVQLFYTCVGDPFPPLYHPPSTVNFLSFFFLLVTFFVQNMFRIPYNNVALFIFRIHSTKKKEATCEYIFKFLRLFLSKKCLLLILLKFLLLSISKLMTIWKFERFDLQ